MNQASSYMKWFYRILLLMLFTAMSFLVTRSGYNTAHWMPHNILRELGLNYQQRLWLETHTDIALHLLGAFVLTLLLYAADLLILRKRVTLILATVVSLCVVAEFAQHILGRDVESKDLLLGILGSFMAYLVIHKNKKAKTKTPTVTGQND
ncbi:hypothetical protein [Arenicella xantha]|uniref:VanZ like protein n=1 Tax=Arenicella xantha TaxID=644221 RepID=A0A395JPP4_9GAMM|nr:hypothetical protein [Arenicella xantha]RBP51538.1 hypothetical protein DFR28_102968 [Arenicella xantha]